MIYCLSFIHGNKLRSSHSRSLKSSEYERWRLNVSGSASCLTRIDIYRPLTLSYKNTNVLTQVFRVLYFYPFYGPSSDNVERVSYLNWADEKLFAFPLFISHDYWFDEVYWNVEFLYPFITTLNFTVSFKQNAMHPRQKKLKIWCEYVSILPPGGLEWRRDH